MSNNSKISISSFGKICRTCLSEGNMKNLYEKCDEDNCLVEMLMCITFVQVSETDGLPYQICLNCEKELTKAYNFAQKCNETDKKLKYCIKDYFLPARKETKATQTKAVNSETNDKIQTTNNTAENKLQNAELETDNRNKIDLDDLILPNHENLILCEHNYCANLTQVILSENKIENNNCSERLHQNETNISDTDLCDKINKNSDSEPQKRRIEKKLSLPIKKKLKKKDNFDCVKTFRENESNISDINLSDGINENSDLEPQEKLIKKKLPVRRKKKENLEMNDRDGTKNTMSKTNESDDINENFHIEPKKKQIKRKTAAPKTIKLNKNENSDECDESLLQNENNFSDTISSDDTKENSDSESDKKQFNGQIPKKKKRRGPPYECKKCFETFGNYKLLWLHWKEVKHPPDYKSSCRICLKEVPYRKMKQHMRVHTLEKPFVCEACGKSFSIKSNLDRHVKIHTGEKPYKCEYCEKAFIQSTCLKEHIRSHTNDKPYVCDMCGKRFASNKFYKLHLYSRHGTRSPSVEPQYECEVCQKKFTTKAILKTHALIHGEKQYLCNHCGMGFVLKGSLTSHIKIHTGEKSYACELCGKTFSQSGSLKSHIFVHTGEKPFVCKICNRGFTQGQHLTKHLRTHSGERPYSCRFCGKKFRQKTNMRVHIRIHTGETPYLCPICNKGFYCSSSMKKHKMRHREDTT